MKRQQLLPHLKHHGCEFRREGANHIIYRNPLTDEAVPVPLIPT